MEPICYACKKGTVRKGSRFCSETCAATWAESYANAMQDAWCPQCNDWLETPHKH